MLLQHPTCGKSRGVEIWAFGGPIGIPAFSHVSDLFCIVNRPGPGDLSGESRNNHSHFTGPAFQHRGRRLGGAVYTWANRPWYLNFV